MDGAPAVSRFIYIVLPHIARAITVVILIETIFLLSVFAYGEAFTQGHAVAFGCIWFALAMISAESWKRSRATVMVAG